MSKRAQIGRGRGRGRAPSPDVTKFCVPIECKTLLNWQDAFGRIALTEDPPCASKVVSQNPTPNLLTLGLSVLESGILDGTCQSILESIDPSQVGATHSLLHNSILRKDFNIVNQLVGLSPACVNTSCLCGAGHFHCAVESGDLRIVNLMISNKADVHAYGRSEMFDNTLSPLHIACATTSYDMAKALVEGGADVCARIDSNGYTPMHTNACFNVRMDESMGNGKGFIEESQRIQTLLLSVKANIDAQNKEGQTPLHIAIRYGVTTMQCFLIRNGADLNVFDNEKRNALIYAVSHGSSAICALLLANRCGIPPYHVPLVCRAASRNGWSMVKQLLNNGADVNETDENGNNAIHYALISIDGQDNCCRETHIIGQLIKHGCNPHLANIAGITPLQVVMKPGPKRDPTHPEFTLSHAEFILLEVTIKRMYHEIYGPTPISAKEVAALLNTSWPYKSVELLFKIASGSPSYTRIANDEMLSRLHTIRSALISDKNAKEMLACEPPTKNAKQRRIERKAEELERKAAKAAHLQAVLRRSLTPPFGHAQSKECTVCFEVCNIATMAVLGPCGHRAVCADCEPRINMVCPSCRQRVLCFVRKIYD